MWQGEPAAGFTGVVHAYPAEGGSLRFSGVTSSRLMTSSSLSSIQFLLGSLIHGHFLLYHHSFFTTFIATGDLKKHPGAGPSRSLSQGRSASAPQLFPLKGSSDSSGRTGRDSLGFPLSFSVWTPKKITKKTDWREQYEQFPPKSKSSNCI